MIFFNSGPHKNCQVITVRSLYGKWKFPIFVAFDQAVTTEIYNEILYALGSIGIRVMLSVCDQGPRNQGLARALGITPSKPFITHPFNPDWSVFWAYDFIHLFKSLRNHILDKTVDFGDGIQASKKDLEDLFRIFKTEVSLGSHLNDKMLSCSGTERQNVSLAYKLMHQDTANLIRQFFPEKQDQAPAKEIHRDSKDSEDSDDNDTTISAAAIAGNQRMTRRQAARKAWFDDCCDSDDNDTTMNTAHSAAAGNQRMTRQAARKAKFDDYFDDCFDSDGSDTTMNTVGDKTNDDSEITAEAAGKQLNVAGKHELADLFELLHKGFKLLSSYELNNADPFRCAIGKHYDIQKPVLVKIKETIEKIRFIKPVKVKPLKTKPAPKPKKQTRKTRKNTKAKVTKAKTTKKSKGKFLLLLHTPI